MLIGREKWLKIRVVAWRPWPSSLLSCWQSLLSTSFSVGASTRRGISTSISKDPLTNYQFINDRSHCVEKCTGAAHATRRELRKKGSSGATQTDPPGGSQDQTAAGEGRRAA